MRLFNFLHADDENASSVEAASASAAAKPAPSTSHYFPIEQEKTITYDWEALKRCIGKSGKKAAERLEELKEKVVKDITDVIVEAENDPVKYAANLAKWTHWQAEIAKAIADGVGAMATLIIP